MKRTRQVFHRPGQDEPENPSGCTQFEGEDLEYHMRKNCDAATIKMWADEKKQQMSDENNRHLQEEADYANQTDCITRFRGLTEDENTKKRLDANKALQIAN